MSDPSPSTKEQILLAAERLIGEHGVDGVSMRQIGTAVGSGNNSAVLYHFGSKESLIRAIFEYRLPRLRERRAALIEERRPSDLRGWLECQIRVVLEQSEQQHSHYMTFVASLSQSSVQAFRQQPRRFVTGQREFDDQLRACLLMVEGAAAHVPARTDHGPDRPYCCDARACAGAAENRFCRSNAELTNLVDCSAGFLEAPVSSATTAALREARADVAHQTLFV